MKTFIHLPKSPQASLCRIAIYGACLLSAGFSLTPLQVKAAPGTVVKPVNSTEALFTAIQRKDLKAIESALNNKANVNARNVDGETPLLCAIAAKQVKVVSMLLNKGADPNLPATYGIPPFMGAVSVGNWEIIKLLLAKRVSVDCRDGDGWTALFYAINNERYDLAEFLLKNGADINAVGTDDLNIMASLASGPEDLTKIEFLAKHGLKPPFKEPSAGALVNYYAGIGDLAKVQELLKSGANPDFPLANSESHPRPLSRAVEINRLDIVKALIAGGAKVDGENAYGSTPLMHAIEHRQFEIAKFLLSKGASVTAKDKYGNGAVRSIPSWNVAPYIDLLLKYGANINEPDAHGLTLLMQMTSNGDVATTRVLLARGADVNATANNGATALSLSAGSPEIIKLLRQHGAKMPPRGRARDLMLIEACHSNNIALVRELLTMGCNINAQDHQGFTALMRSSFHPEHDDIAQLLLANGASVNTRKATKINLLVEAAGNGNIELLIPLLHRGLKIDSHEPFNQDTALHVAVKYGELETVRFLIKRKAPLNIVNVYGSTPLMLAVANKQILTAKLLLASGADVSIRNKIGKTALDFAKLHLPALVPELKKAEKRSVKVHSNRGRHRFVIG